ncbi:MAG: hypothetical protein WKF75_03085 [Singulisphaera sp.]
MLEGISSNAAFAMLVMSALVSGILLAVWVYFEVWATRGKKTPTGTCERSA